jgi:hypothetical protein
VDAVSFHTVRVDPVPGTADRGKWEVHDNAGELVGLILEDREWLGHAWGDRHLHRGSQPERRAVHRRLALQRAIRRCPRPSGRSPNIWRGTKRGRRSDRRLAHSTRRVHRPRRVGQWRVLDNDERTVGAVYEDRRWEDDENYGAVRYLVVHNPSLRVSGTCWRGEGFTAIPAAIAALERHLRDEHAG